MVSDSGAASMVSAPALMVAARPPSSTMYSSGLSVRLSTAPGSTADVATTKLVPRVIQVLLPISVSCGGAS